MESVLLAQVAASLFLSLAQATDRSGGSEGAVLSWPSAITWQRNFRWELRKPKRMAFDSSILD